MTSKHYTLTAIERGDIDVLATAMELSRGSSDRAGVRRMMRMITKYLDASSITADNDNFGQLVVNASRRGTHYNRRQMANWASIMEYARTNPETYREAYKNEGGIKAKLRECRRMFDLHREALRMARAAEAVEYGIERVAWQAEGASWTSHFERMFDSEGKVNDAYIALLTTLPVVYGTADAARPELRFGSFLDSGVRAGWVAGQLNAHTLAELGEWFSRERTAMAELASRAW